jgi:hypothetical protein
MVSAPRNQNRAQNILVENASHTALTEHGGLGCDWDHTRIWLARANWRQSALSLLSQNV